ncbi:MAG: peptidase T [Kiritimatiellaeota bacterium]|nr:peptidase T [Kiritimatiellota bacterium]
MNQSALERFLRYVRIDTQSAEDATRYPSTAKQFDLLKLLVAELQDLGLRDVVLDERGLVMASVPGNLPPGHPARGRVPVIGLIAHVDTSPSVSGKDVRPQVVEYRGGDLTLPGDGSVVIRASENPELLDNVGRTIVTSDGTTLLGADDKAGVAIIMTAVQTLLADSKPLHGDIRICFTPDEEVGRGTEHFDLEKFGAQVAYTVDGDTPGELNRETFSADQAIITVHGRNIHPGSAKGIMVNALRAMGDILVRMPQDLAPETTEGYEPFIHPHVLEGAEAKATLKVLLRDFRTPGLADLKARLEQIVAEVRALHPKTRIVLEIKPQYRNMKDFLGNDPRVLDCLWEAARRAGLEPVWKPIRGGTDGSRLTERGLPCPNIFTGGQNFHGPTEWLSVSGMEKSVATVVHLVQVWAEKSSETLSEISIRPRVPGQLQPPQKPRPAAIVDHR